MYVYMYTECKQKMCYKCVRIKCTHKHSICVSLCVCVSVFFQSSLDSDINLSMYHRNRQRRVSENPHPLTPVPEVTRIS